MSSEAKRSLDRLVADCCLQLFSDYRLEIEASDPGALPTPNRQFLLSGIIGFTSRHLRGAVVLATTQEPLEKTNPATNPSHRDWICELANQLLGRVKNQLLARGVEIFASTPIALRGEHLSPVLQQSLIAELFIAGGGVVCVWMDCEVDAGFELPVSGHFEAAPVSEGETLLF